MTFNNTLCDCKTKSTAPYFPGGGTIDLVKFIENLVKKGSSAHFALFDLWMNNPNGKPASNVINSPSRENTSVLARSSAKDSESAEAATAENGGRMSGWWTTLASTSQDRNNTIKGMMW